MPNPFYTAMGAGKQNGSMNFMQALQDFKANPLKFMLQRKLNVPSNILNDPNAILQHLLATGQISQSRVNSAYQEIQNGGFNNYGR